MHLNEAKKFDTKGYLKKDIKEVQRMINSFWTSVVAIATTLMVAFFPSLSPFPQLKKCSGADHYFYHNFLYHDNKLNVTKAPT
jgi:hypothetical protein